MSEWRVILLPLVLGAAVAACAPEATAPGAGAATARVIPIAVPDVWCEAGDDSADTAAARGRCRPAQSLAPSEAHDSTWQVITGRPTLVGSDSARVAADSSR